MMQPTLIPLTADLNICFDIYTNSNDPMNCRLHAFIFPFRISVHKGYFDCLGLDLQCLNIRVRSRAYKMRTRRLRCRLLDLRQAVT